MCNCFWIFGFRLCSMRVRSLILIPLFKFKCMQIFDGNKIETSFIHNIIKMRKFFTILLIEVIESNCFELMTKKCWIFRSKKMLCRFRNGFMCPSTSIDLSGTYTHFVNVYCKWFRHRNLSIIQSTETCHFSCIYFDFDSTHNIKSSRECRAKSVP